MRERSARSAGPKTSQARDLLLEGPARELAIGLPVLLAGALSNFLRQSGRGRLLIPMDRLEVIADVLLVVGGLRAPRLIRIRGPKTGRIRRQHLVGQHDLAVNQAKFEFGVRDDNATLAGVIGGAPVQLQRKIA